MLLASVRSSIKPRLQRAMSSTGRQALLLSSSNCHGFTTLEFARSEIDQFFKKNNISELLFVPYAQTDFDAYTNKIKSIIEPWGYKVTGIHTHPDARGAVQSAKAIFIGGGNTFTLLKRLYENNLVELIRKRVFEEGLLYVGSSAGTNVATKSIHTTNDMPIDFPPTFDGIGLVPFNINPHYLETPPSTHHGETRDQRILEYLEMPHAGKVLGLREGAMLHVEGDSAVVKGIAGAVIFGPTMEHLDGLERELERKEEVLTCIQKTHQEMAVLNRKVRRAREDQLDAEGAVLPANRRVAIEEEKHARYMKRRVHKLEKRITEAEGELNRLRNEKHCIDVKLAPYTERFGRGMEENFFRGKQKVELPVGADVSHLLQK